MSDPADRYDTPDTSVIRVKRIAELERERDEAVVRCVVLVEALKDAVIIAELEASRKDRCKQVVALLASTTDAEREIRERIDANLEAEESNG